MVRGTLHSHVHLRVAATTWVRRLLLRYLFGMYILSSSPFTIFPGQYERFLLAFTRFIGLCSPTRTSTRQVNMLMAIVSSFVLSMITDGVYEYCDSINLPSSTSPTLLSPLYKRHLSSSQHTNTSHDAFTCTDSPPCLPPRGLQSHRRSANRDHIHPRLTVTSVVVARGVSCFLHNTQ
jgi:hypothetical protein